jgi:hypothetical protein
MRAPWRRGNRRIRGVSLAAITIVGVMALPAAAAQADALWAGASASPEWSSPTNWDPSSTTPPTTNGTAAGTITFPDLGTTSACTTTCYTSHNGLTGITATGLVFGNTTAGTSYHILGNGLTLGTGGILNDSGGGTGNVINTPLALNGNQTWTIGAPFGAGTTYNSLSLANTAAVTGTSTLGVTFPTGPGNAFGGDLFVGSDVEVGAITVSGSGGLHIGSGGAVGSVNGTNGNAVGLTNKATLIANPGASVGALTSTGGKLLLGTGGGNAGTTTLSVKGAVALDSASTFSSLVNDNGSTAGTDFSQLTATGDISLNGALSLAQGQVGGSCATLNRGDVATLITTTGTVSGTFTGVPDGTVVNVSGTSQCAGAQFRINYTAHSVTATVASGTTPTSTTLATPNPSPASTNQKVTLTATVATNTNGSVTPSGTVAFAANGAPISGCTSQPVTASGSTGTATCQTSFSASSSPESLTATFTGASGAGQAGSSSSAQSLTVAKGSTQTKLAVSNASPAANASVTYTATVAPGVIGGASPSGTVQFLDGGSVIAGCDARPLTAGTATCTVSYPSGGSHTITAAYSGDANFSGSTSSPATVTVSAPPPPPRGRLLGPGGRLTVIGRTIRFTEKCQSKVLCRGRFSLTATVRGRHGKLTTVRCASGSFRIRANRSATLRVTLSSACMRLLRAQRHHRLTVMYTSQSSTGQVGQRKRIVLVLR